MSGARDWQELSDPLHHAKQQGKKEQAAHPQQTHETNTSPPSTTQPPTSMAPLDEANLGLQVGETADMDGLEVTVEDAFKTRGSNWDSDMLESGEVYLVVRVHLVNNSQQTYQSLGSGYDWSAGGPTFATLERQKVGPREDRELAGTYRPGREGRGTLAFVVYEDDWVPLEFTPVMTAPTSNPGTSTPALDAAEARWNVGPVAELPQKPFAPPASAEAVSNPEDAAEARQSVDPENLGLAMGETATLYTKDGGTIEVTLGEAFTTRGDPDVDINQLDPDEVFVVVRAHLVNNTSISVYSGGGGQAWVPFDRQPKKLLVTQLSKQAYAQGADKGMTYITDPGMDVRGTVAFIARKNAVVSIAYVPLLAPKAAWDIGPVSDLPQKPFAPPSEVPDPWPSAPPGDSGAEL